MWPFKRKKIPLKEFPEDFKTVICIPGNWKSWDEFILLVVKATNGKYIAAGPILLHVSKNMHYTIEFCERDEKMRSAFKYAGSGTGVGETFLNEIGNHTAVVYISGPGGSLQQASDIALAACAILKAGGIGVKVETAGKAFEKYKWLDLVETFKQGNLYQMFVVDSIANKKEDTIFSCGMQNLGYKDTIVSGQEFVDAVHLISIFSIYQLVDKPTVLNGQTFQKTITSPVYRITDELNQPYMGDGIFGNPFGMWRLTRL